MTDATNPNAALSDHLHGQGAPASDTGENAMPELKPCPFCGGAARVISGGSGNHFVKCGRCRVSTDDGSVERASRTWNTRADPTQPQTVAVEVKPLVWDNGYASEGPCFYADDPGEPGRRYLAFDGDDKAALWAKHSRSVLSRITTRSVDEVRNEALEEAAQACADYPRVAPSEDEWTRYDEQIEYSQQCIRALKSQPASALAQDEAVQRLVEAAEHLIGEIYQHAENGHWIYPSIRSAMQDLRAALAAMEGR